MKMVRTSLGTVASGVLRWLGVMLLALTLLGSFGFVAPKTLAAADPYTYTVTVNAGREGQLNPNGIAVPSHATISGDDQHLRITGLNYGDRISFLGNIATAAEGSDYYVRGIRYGGRDGNTSLAELSFEVTEDRDYVVAFARANDLVPYTVQYVTDAGDVLYEDQVYYGNVGDKPVVACLYFDGYQPRAYNITKTLDANPEENVLTFVYDPIVLPEPEPEGPGPEPAPEVPSAPGADDAVSAPEPTGDGTPGATNPAQVGDTPSGAGEEVPTNPVNPDGNPTELSTPTVLSETTNGENAPVLATNNGGGSPAPAAPTPGAGGTGADAGDDGTGVDETATVAEETIEDNANPLASTEQLADLDTIEDDATPLALFGSAIPRAGSQNAGLSPWLLGLMCAAIVLVVILAGWLIYDRRSRRAFAASAYSAPTDVPYGQDSNDD